MHSRILLLGLGLLGAVLPGSAIAQSEIRYPDGLVLQPLPVVPGLYPGGMILNVPASRPPYSMPAPNVDVNITASTTAPRMMTVLPEQETVDRPGCGVQSYTFGPRTRVRVHRC